MTRTVEDVSQLAAVVNFLLVFVPPPEPIRVSIRVPEAGHVVRRAPHGAAHVLHASCIRYATTIRQQHSAKDFHPESVPDPDPDPGPDPDPDPECAIRNAQHDALQRRTKSPHARLKAQNCAVASFVA